MITLLGFSLKMIKDMQVEEDLSIVQAEENRVTH